MNDDILIEVFRLVVFDPFTLNDVDHKSARRLAAQDSPRCDQSRDYASICLVSKKWKEIASHCHIESLYFVQYDGDNGWATRINSFLMSKNKKLRDSIRFLFFSFSYDKDDSGHNRDMNTHRLIAACKNLRATAISTTNSTHILSIHPVRYKGLPDPDITVNALKFRVYLAMSVDIPVFTTSREYSWFLRSVRHHFLVGNTSPCIVQLRVNTTDTNIRLIPSSLMLFWMETTARQFEPNRHPSIFEHQMDSHPTQKQLEPVELSIRHAIENPRHFYTPVMFINSIRTGVDSICNTLYENYPYLTTLTLHGRPSSEYTPSFVFPKDIDKYVSTLRTVKQRSFPEHIFDAEQDAFIEVGEVDQEDDDYLYDETDHLVDFSGDLSKFIHRRPWHFYLGLFIVGFAERNSNSRLVITLEDLSREDCIAEEDVHEKIQTGLGNGIMSAIDEYCIDQINCNIIEVVFRE